MLGPLLAANPFAPPPHARLVLYHASAPARLGETIHYRNVPKK